MPVLIEQETGSSILVLFPQIIKYLVASERLCELGYDETQVEEALEMFQNSESKVTNTDCSGVTAPRVYFTVLECTCNEQTAVE